MVVFGKRHGPRKVWKDGLKRLVSVMARNGKKNGTRESRNSPIREILMVVSLKMNMIQMAAILRNQIVKSGERTKNHRKSGMKNGVNSTNLITNKNGVISGKLI